MSDVYGTMKIVSASHPTSVTVNQLSPWLLEAEAQGGYVYNPFIAYIYQDGPASSITLVEPDCTTVDVPLGSAAIMYLTITESITAGEVLSTPSLFLGTIFPQAGTYTIQFATGTLSDQTASQGTYLADVYDLLVASDWVGSVQDSTQYSVVVSAPAGGGTSGGGGGTVPTPRPSPGPTPTPSPSPTPTPSPTPSTGVPWYYALPAAAGLIFVGGVIVYTEATKKR